MNRSTDFRTTKLQTYVQIFLATLISVRLLVAPPPAEAQNAALCPAVPTSHAMPRPSGDNGWGIHFSPASESPEPAALDFFIREMQAMNIKWVKILNRETHFASDTVVDAIVGAGMEPVMRIQDEDLAPFHPPDLRNLVDHYLKRGVRYYELYNEPNLLDEWPAGSDIDIAYVADVWIPAAHAIQSAGGYPSTPALAPGGHWEDMDFWRLFLHEVRRRAENGDTLAYEVLCGNGSPDWPALWIANHNYGLNHYFDYPADTVNREAVPVSQNEIDYYGIEASQVHGLNEVRAASERPFYVGDDLLDASNGFFKFIAHGEIFRNIIGFLPPILVTEGGWIAGQAQDPRYPPVSDTYLRNETLRGYSYMQREAPAHLLTWMPWILCNFACGGTDPRFEDHAWYKVGALETNQTRSDDILSVVHAIKGHPDKALVKAANPTVSPAVSILTRTTPPRQSRTVAASNQSTTLTTQTVSASVPQPATPRLSRAAADLLQDAALRLGRAQFQLHSDDPRIKVLPDPVSVNNRYLVINTANETVTLVLHGQHLTLAPNGQAVIALHGRSQGLAALWREDDSGKYANRINQIAPEQATQVVQPATASVAAKDFQSRIAATIPIIPQTPIQTNTYQEPAYTVPTGQAFGIANLTRLSCEENQGMANLFVKVLDTEGKLLDGVALEFNTPDGTNPITTTSGDKGPGKAEFPLISGHSGGRWVVQVAASSGGSLPTTPLRTDLPDDPCPSRGNTTGHYSYRVTIHEGAPSVIPAPRQPLEILPVSWRFPDRRTIGSPVSPLRPLSDWPRPSGDNGWGLHFLPLAAFDEFTLDLFIYHMLELDLRWVTVYYENEPSLRLAAEKFRDAGMMVVWRPKVRPYEPYPAHLIERDLTILRQAGMPPYIQLFNEPTLGQEWDGRPYDWNLYLRHFLDAADATYATGGYIGVQDIDPDSLARLLDVVKEQKPYLLPEMFFIPHCYGSNHPPDYPYDVLNQATFGTTIEDDHNASVLCFLKYADVWQDIVGFIPPMIMSESGWASNTMEDDRYPRISLEDHRDYHLAMFDWFPSGTLSNGQPLPDYLFAITPWLIGGAGQMQFEENAWFYSKLTGSKYLTIEAIRNQPPFER